MKTFIKDWWLAGAVIAIIYLLAQCKFMTGVDGADCDQIKKLHGSDTAAAAGCYREETILVPW